MSAYNSYCLDLRALCGGTRHFRATESRFLVSFTAPESFVVAVHQDLVPVGPGAPVRSAAVVDVALVELAHRY